MQPRLRAAVATFVATAVSASAGALVTGFHVEHGSAAGSSGSFITNDLFIDFTGQYTGSQVLITLDTGVINQELFFGGPSDTAVSEEALASFPNLAADTYFTNGGFAGQQQYGNPIIVGGPVNIDFRMSARVETPTQIGNTWSIAGGVFILDQTDFQVMRLALSDDANGSFQYLASAGDGLDNFFYTLQNNRPGGAPLYEILNGMIVPTGIDPNPDPEPDPDPEPEPDPDPDPTPAPDPAPDTNPPPFPDPDPFPGPDGGPPSAVPTPSAFAAGLIGLGLLASRRRRIH